MAGSTKTGGGGVDGWAGVTLWFLGDGKTECVPLVVARSTPQRLYLAKASSGEERDALGRCRHALRGSDGNYYLDRPTRRLGSDGYSTYGGETLDVPPAGLVLAVRGGWLGATPDLVVRAAHARAVARVAHAERALAAAVKWRDAVAALVSAGPA